MIIFNNIKKWWDFDRIFIIYIGLFLISLLFVLLIMVDITLPHKLPSRFFEDIEDGSKSIDAYIDDIDNLGNVNLEADNFNAESLSNPSIASSYHTLWLRNNNVDDNIRIRGWAFIPGENTTAPLVSYVLYDETTQEYYKLHTELEERPDVTEAFGQSGNYNYDLSGIVGNVPSFFLKRKHVYTVGIIYQHNDQYFLYMSDKQINTKGEMN